MSPALCGERMILYPGEGRRMVLACVDDPGHDPTKGHRSGTDPVVRWRYRREEPTVTDVWLESWRDWNGRTVAEREAAGLVT